MNIHRTDILVIGSGLAGISFALKAAEFAKVTILTKDKFASTNTAMAQGGIAAVMAEDDSFESHVQDTLIAGAGLCREDIVREFVGQAPERIKDLINWGVRFDVKHGPTGDSIDLTREGGHTFRRILHHEDQTGLEIHTRLAEKVRANPNIEILENQFAIDFIINKQTQPYEMTPTSCQGAYSLNKETHQVDAFIAKVTVVATGGAGKAYLYTSNWSGATGDGIAMAYRAGARIANMEFMQFHPTCLFHPEARNFLISEALRGEGGELINSKGQPFMKKYHPLGSLAPRDIVARSIDSEIKLSGDACVFLDMTKHPRDYLKTRFPAIFAKCLKYGIDMSVKPIPVVPAAHYLCGGILTNHHGQTDIQGLFSLGESSCTGFHGANRLASNSLLECLTTAHNASEFLKSRLSQISAPNTDPAPWIEPTAAHPDELIVISHLWDEIRRLMWNYVGIVRSNKRLDRAKHRLENILSEFKEYYSQYKLSSDMLELRNISILADLTVKCALKRKESRGIHYSLDYPETKTEAKDTILVRGLN